MGDWIIFNAIIDFFNQLRDSWNNDFVPSFMIGLRIFLLAFLCVIIVCLALLVMKIIGYFKNGGSKGKADGKAEAKDPGGEAKK